MNIVKSLSLAVAGLMLSSAAWAAEIGVVDVQQVTQRYAKAQTLSAQVKDKEQELAKLRDTLADQLKAADKKSPVEKKTLEEKLNKEFASKFQEYRDWAATQEQALRASFDQAVQTVGQSKGLDLVLPKQTVLRGGMDITNEVVEYLNKQ